MKCAILGAALTAPFLPQLSFAQCKDTVTTTLQHGPNPNQWGMLVFEDNWPQQGDFDFNDAVIAYNVNSVGN